MKEEQVKTAFARVRQDIDFLGDELSTFKSDIFEIKQILKELLDSQHASTLRHITSTHPVTSTDTSTVPYEIQGLRTPNLGSSIGNEGASTDRQTIRQTDNHTDIYPKNEKITMKNKKTMDSNIQEASEILNSLDGIKKEIRLKIKHLTPQEMIVFTTIYQLEEQNQDEIDYKTLSNKLKLSQSSIRDYIQRMINKGIPIHKNKINNKKITLSISPDLKKIASLPTIIRLREL